MFLNISYIFHLRKRSKASTSSNQSTAAEQNAQRDNFRPDSEYADIPETAPSYKNAPRMYTTPIVKKYENFPQNTRGNIINTPRDLEEYEYISNSRRNNNIEPYSAITSREPATYEDLRTETRDNPDTTEMVYTKLDHDSVKRFS